jgi:ATP-dependent RNA helicase DeaD
MKFQDFGISRESIRAIEDLGFEEPTPIQSLAIPLIMTARDVTGQAQTGTGKTAAFGIPIIERIDPSVRAVRTLVLCPTRELAIQIAEEFSKLAKYKSRIAILPVYGGQPIERQLRALRAGVHIVIGTPGRVMDHLDRGTLSLDRVNIVVLDEADQMLDMGFLEDIETILAHVPKERQTLLFSATMPQPILAIAKKFQRSPEFVKVIHHELTVPQIEQTYMEVRDRDKLDVLCRLIDIFDPRLALVFTNTKRGVDELAGHLRARGYFVEGLHGDMKQSQRDRVMAKFRTGKIDVLIATDVAARGIDVEEIDTVFNYDVPQDVEYYVHRIGRTGRAGRGGRAITFVAPREIFKLHEIQKFAKIRIARQPVPTAEDVEETKTRHFFTVIRQAIEEGRLEKYMKLVEREMINGTSSLEIAAALLRMQLEPGPGVAEAGEIAFGDTGAGPGFVRFYLAVGRSHGVSPKDIVGAIANETGIPGRSIGAIRVLDDFSFVEIPEDQAHRVYEIMAGRTIRGNPTGIAPANRRE